MTHLPRRTVFLAVTLLSVAVLFRVERYHGTLYHGWDAQFYYSLAHSIVFDRDVDITNDMRETPSPAPFDPAGDGSFSEMPKRESGRFASKYPVGMSAFEAPWLVLGHLLRRAAELSMGSLPAPVGYSRLELWGVIIGLVVSFAWAMAMLFSWLASSYGTSAAAIGLTGCWLGTSLFYYSAVFPFMSHALSFTVLVLVMGAARTVVAGENLNRALAWLGASLAALLLVRPQQILIAIFLAPLVLRSLAGAPVRKWLSGLVTAIALGTAAIGLTAAENYAQFGTWSLSGYAAGQEGFDWLRPHLSFVLFSESRGLLVFSPVVLFATIGYLRPNVAFPSYLWPFVANAVAQVYLIAAWSSPEQGDAFGARMWSDNTAVVAFGLAALSERHTGWMLAAVIGGVASCVMWTCYLLARYALS